MDILAQRKLLIQFVIILALLNVSLLSVLVWRSFHPKRDNIIKPLPPAELSKLLKNELGLTTQQADSLQTIRLDFFSKEKIISEQTKQKRDSMNMLMFSDNANDSTLKQLAKDISANEYNIELLRIGQAKKFRVICNENQLKKLEKLLKEIRDYLKPEIADK